MMGGGAIAQPGHSSAMYYGNGAGQMMENQMMAQHQAMHGQAVPVSPDTPCLSTKRAADVRKGDESGIRASFGRGRTGSGDETVHRRVWIRRWSGNVRRRHVWARRSGIWLSKRKLVRQRLRQRLGSIVQ